MRKYGELSALFGDLVDAENLYFSTNEMFASKLLEGFYDYGEVPRDFVDRAKAEVVPYLSLHKIEDGKVQGQILGVTRAVSSFYDGSFHFGIGVILDCGRDAWPKTRLFLEVYCKRTEDKVEVRIQDREATECEFDGQGFENVYEDILSELFDFVEIRPGSSERNRPIGFVLNGDG